MDNIQMLFYPDLNNKKEIREQNAESKEIKTWSNMSCITKAITEDFPTNVNNLQVQKNIVNRFINFYLGGKAEKGLSVTDIVFAALAIMPIKHNDEKFIWHPIHYDDNGTLFFLTPEDKLNYEVKNVKNEEATVSDSTVAGETVEGDIINEQQQYESDATKLKEMEKTNDEQTSTTSQETNKNSKSEKPENIDEFYDWEGNDNYNLIDDDTKTKLKNEKNESVTELKSLIVSYLPRKTIEKSQTHISDDFFEYGPVENAAFISSCNKIMESWDADTEGRTVLKYFIGVVALTLMRATTKTYKHIVSTFSSAKFRETILFSKDKISYSIPHKRCFKNSYRTLRKRDDKVCIMFAKIVCNSFYIQALFNKNSDKKKKILNIFRISVLSHTYNYGMGLVGLWQTLYNFIEDKDVITLLETTLCNATNKSWHTLLVYLRNYVPKSAMQFTHHWARVISGTYFKGLACSDNFVFSVILGVFVEKHTFNKDLWKSSWAVNNEKLETYKAIGEKMYTKFNYIVMAPQRALIEEEQKKRKEETVHFMKNRPPLFKNKNWGPILRSNDSDSD